MLRNRVIPVLLVKDHGLVKTTNFKDPRYIGDPINAIRIFNEKEADELMLLDIEASKDRRGPNFSLITDIASECFMPLSYGGGIRNLDDAQMLFSLGVEKIVLRTGAAQSPSLISEIVAFAGSSSVTVSIDLKKTRFGRYSIHCPGSSAHGSTEWLDFVRTVMRNGAGEILLNSVDRDGTMQGPDLQPIRTAAAICTVPLVAVGGVGSLDDIRAAIGAGADAVAAGAFFVFHGPRRAVLITYPSYGELAKVLGDI
jgi:cyclase